MTLSNGHLVRFIAILYSLVTSFVARADNGKAVTIDLSR